MAFPSRISTDIVSWSSCLVGAIFKWTYKIFRKPKPEHSKHTLKAFIWVAYAALIQSVYKVYFII